MPQNVEIKFGAKVGAAPFDCTQTYPHLGVGDTSASIGDLRFYVHDLRLIDASNVEVPVVLDQDGLWQVENVALLDFENKQGACANGTAETNASVKGTVPAGTYLGIAFKLGVPASLNHLDAATAPSPLNLSGLFWTWTDGYKFIRVDMTPQGSPSPFLLHLGAGGCTGDPSLGEVTTCSHQNIPEMVFHAFDAGKQTLVFDLASALAESDLSTDGGGAPGCMSDTTDPECVPLFPRLGLDLATGAPTPDTQHLFRVE